MSDALYTDGGYLANNPTWHLEDSAWKANQVLAMLRRNGLQPRTICEVGCGVGEILRQLHDRGDREARLTGYEISPQAFELAVARSTDRLTFRLGDVLDTDETFELLLLIDVIEHVEDYFSLLRGLRGRGDHLMLHIPLELSAVSVLREVPMRFSRERLGHLHFFTRDMALDMLRELGYEIVDWMYTPASSRFPDQSWRLRLLERARRALFPLSETAAVRTLGGYSLLVLTR